MDTRRAVVRRYFRLLNGQFHLGSMCRRRGRLAEEASSETILQHQSAPRYTMDAGSAGERTFQVFKMAFRDGEESLGQSWALTARAERPSV